MNLDLYPSIKKAVVLIAHDCECITPERTEADAVSNAQHSLEDQFSDRQLQEVEARLKELDDAEFMKACIGEQSPLTQMPESEILVHSVLDQAASGFLEH
jgi:hypothetical protein